MDPEGPTLVTICLSATGAYRKTLHSLDSIYNTLFPQICSASKVMLSLWTSRRSASKRIPRKFITPTVKKTSITLQDAHASDIGALARVHVAAFRDDRYVRLMYSECSHWEAIDAMLESQYSQADCMFQIALTGPKDCIAGWICCSLVGNPKAPTRSLLAHHELTTALTQVVNVLQADLTRKSGARENPAQYRQREQLWKIVSQNATDAQISAVADQRYLVVNTLVTDPSFSGRQIGSELLAWVTRYADREKLRIWAQVSPAATGTFQRAGFEEVAIMGLDLGDFCQGDRVDDKEAMDLCEFTFMSRDPGRRSSR